MSYTWKRYCHKLISDCLKCHALASAKQCTECGVFSNKLEYHHDDYEFPMCIRALCITCHHKWHRENFALNTDLVSFDSEMVVEGHTLSKKDKWK